MWGGRARCRARAATAPPPPPPAPQIQPRRPPPPPQRRQHPLLQRVLAVVDGDRVVVPVEAVDEGLDRGFVQVPQIGRRLPRLLPQHHGLRVDEPERVDHDFAAHRLDGVDDDRDGARVERFKRLLRPDVDAGEPAAEAGVGVVPADDHLGAPGLGGARREGAGRRAASAAGGAPPPPSPPRSRTCFSMSSILVWNTGSTASTETPVPDCEGRRGPRRRARAVRRPSLPAPLSPSSPPTCGMAKTSTTRTV